jgi:protein-tyrosine phosphatase
MIDIHSHILHGLDDGAKTMADSVAMLKIAAESGTTDIVATPHANQKFTFDPDLIDRKIAELQVASGPLPRIHRGCDFHLTIENIDDAVAHPSKYTINQKRYLLVELSNSIIPKTIHDIFARLQDTGLVPVITHPERNSFLQTRLDLLRGCVEEKCLVQVTAQSLLGRFGRTANRIATQLLQENLVHFIASDAHDPKHRSPALREAYDYTAKTWGEQRAYSLFVNAPQAALLGTPFDAPLANIANKKKWYSFGQVFE